MYLNQPVRFPIHNKSHPLLATSAPCSTPTISSLRLLIIITTHESWTQPRTHLLLPMPLSHRTTNHVRPQPALRLLGADLPLVDPFDADMQDKAEKSTTRLWNEVSKASFLNTHNKAECVRILEHLRLCRVSVFQTCSMCIISWRLTRIFSCMFTCICTFVARAGMSSCISFNQAINLFVLQRSAALDAQSECLERGGQCTATRPPFLDKTGTDRFGEKGKMIITYLVMFTYIFFSISANVLIKHGSTMS